MAYMLTPKQQAQVQAVRDRPPQLNAMGYPSGFVDQNERDARNYEIRYDQKNRDKSRQKKINALWMAGAMAPLGFALAPGGALAGMYAGGAAGGAAGGVSLPEAATAGIGFSAAGPATSAAPGAMATLGKVFSSKGAELGVNSALSLYGQHQQNKANDQARSDALRAQREAIALQRQQLEAEIRNADLDRADAKAANDALNELRRRELAAAEEERAYTRSKDEAYESRMGPYRDISAQALRKLQSMWGLA